MSTTARYSLTAALRSRIADDRATATAFTLALATPATPPRSALLEMANGYLNLTVTGTSDVPSFRWNLSDPQYATAARLMSQLRAQKGLIVTDGDAGDDDFASPDLVVSGLPDLAVTKSVAFRHRMFSDLELTRILEEAIAAHNPNYTTSASVPKAEHQYVLHKAAALACRAIAMDSGRRAGIDPGTYLKLADSHDQAYERDTKRQARAIPVPKVDESRVGTGDIMVGEFTRPSFRLGVTVSPRSATTATPPQLAEVQEGDCFDDSILLRWNSYRDDSFAYYELWRDTVPNIVRPRTPAGTDTASPFGYPGFDGPTGGQETTSVRILGRDGGSRVDDTCVLDTGPLEPETLYFYRLYLVNKNGEVSASAVRSARTKALRARFRRATPGDIDPTALSVRQGPLSGGTTLVIQGRYLRPGVTVTLGGKPAEIVSMTATEVTVLTPAFVNPATAMVPQAIVLTSPNGLRDVYTGAFTYLPEAP